MFVLFDAANVRHFSDPAMRLEKRRFMLGKKREAPFLEPLYTRLAEQLCSSTISPSLSCDSSFPLTHQNRESCGKHIRSLGKHTIFGSLCKAHKSYLIIKQHLLETFLTGAQNIIREGSEKKRRRLKNKTAKAQKKIGEGSIIFF